MHITSVIKRERRNRYGRLHFFRKIGLPTSSLRKIEEELICLVGYDVLAGMKKVNLERCCTAFHWERLFISKWKQNLTG